MPDLTQIAQFGVAGLAVYLMFKLSSNHVEHNTQAVNELKEAIRALIDYLRKD